jgi:hypothetical protein
LLVAAAARGDGTIEAPRATDGPFALYRNEDISRPSMSARLRKLTWRRPMTRDELQSGLRAYYKLMRAELEHCESPMRHVRLFVYSTPARAEGETEWVGSLAVVAYNGAPLPAEADDSAIIIRLDENDAESH